MTEHPVPVDLDAERAVCAAIMTGDASDVFEVLDPADMYDTRHEQVTLAVKHLTERGHPHDAIAVVDDLSKRGALVGGFDASYVHELAGFFVPAATAVYHAEIVAKKAARRRLLAAAGVIAQVAVDESVEVADAVEAARERVDQAVAARARVAPVGDDFLGFVQRMEEKPRIVPTPWWDVNTHISGWGAGRLHMVGARPASGKSIVGLMAAMDLAKRGPVAFCSLEMSKDEVVGRMIAQTAKVPLGQIVNHAVTRDSWERIAKVQDRVSSLPVFVSTSDEVSTVGQVRSFARSVSRKGPLAGVVVDYLQLLTSGAKAESRQVEVAMISRSLKLLAQSLRCPVIALSQLNRAPARGKNTRPTMADLRESGALEQDADVVMLLHRDHRFPGVLEVDVAKNRHGTTGRTELVWEGQFARAVSRSWVPTELEGVQ